MSRGWELLKRDAERRASEQFTDVGYAAANVLVTLRAAFFADSLELVEGIYAIACSRAPPASCIGPRFASDESSGKLDRLAFRHHELRLQPLVHFLGAPERFLHVIADVFFSYDVGEFGLVDQL